VRVAESLFTKTSAYAIFTSSQTATEAMQNSSKASQLLRR
jgi:hypothetical protein